MTVVCNVIGGGEDVWVKVTTHDIISKEVKQEEAHTKLTNLPPVSQLQTECLPSHCLFLLYTNYQLIINILMMTNLQLKLDETTT